MLTPLIQSYVADILGFLQSHRDFFAQDVAARESLLSGLALPKPAKIVLTKMDETTFMKELGQVYAAFTDGKVTGSLLSSLAIFLSRELGDLVDGVAEHSYGGHFAVELNSLISSWTIQELSEEVHTFLGEFGHTPYIVVQSPFALSAQTRSEMRKHFRGEYKLSFPQFSVNKQLIGGIRIFIDGQTQDLSWISRINALSTLLYSR